MPVEKWCRNFYLQFRYLVSRPKRDEVAACDDPAEFAHKTKGRWTVCLRLGASVMNYGSDVPNAKVGAGDDDNYSEYL